MFQAFHKIIQIIFERYHCKENSFETNKQGWHFSSFSHDHTIG